MKFCVPIIIYCAAVSVTGYASPAHLMLSSRGLFNSNSRKNAGLRTPLLGPLSSSSSKPEASEATNVKAKISAKAGAVLESDIAASNAASGLRRKWNSVGPGKAGSLQESDPTYTKVEGRARAGGLIEAETAANRVKVKMNIGYQALGAVSRKQKDGTWLPNEVFPDKGRLRKYFKNDDGSPVEVRASLWGDGSLRMTGDQTAPRMKTGRNYEPNE